MSQTSYEMLYERWNGSVAECDALRTENERLLEQRNEAWNRGSKLSDDFQNLQHVVRAYVRRQSVGGEHRREITGCHICGEVWPCAVERLREALEAP